VTHASVGKPLDPDWLLCPYCESEIEGVTPATKPRLPGQRERESAEVEPAEFNEPFDTDEVEAFDYASENPDTVTAEHAEAPPVDDLEERR
jgi:hypothetical protein